MENIVINDINVSHIAKQIKLCKKQAITEVSNLIKESQNIIDFLYSSITDEDDARKECLLDNKLLKEKGEILYNNLKLADFIADTLGIEYDLDYGEYDDDNMYSKLETFTYCDDIQNNDELSVIFENTNSFLEYMNGQHVMWNSSTC